MCGHVSTCGHVWSRVVTCGHVAGNVTCGPRVAALLVDSVQRHIRRTVVDCGGLWWFPWKASILSTQHAVLKVGQRSDRDRCFILHAQFIIPPWDLNKGVTLALRRGF